MARDGYRGARLADLVEAADDEVRRTGLDLADAFAKHGEAMIRQNTPVETSALRESWERTDAIEARNSVGGYVSMRWSGRVWRATVFTTISYAPFVEEGTGLWGPRRQKYKIAPKDPNGVLAFKPYLRANGSVVINLDGSPSKDGKVYARFVMHPGSPGQHMIRIGQAKAEHDEAIWSEEPLRAWARRVESGMRRKATSRRMANA